MKEFLAVNAILTTLFLSLKQSFYQKNNIKMKKKNRSLGA
jgi:hypothetical protein